MPGTVGPSAANQLAIAKLPIEQAKDVNKELSQIRPIVPTDVPTSQKNNFLSQLRDAFNNTIGIARDNEGEVTDMQNDVRSEDSQIAMASSYFDLSKVSQSEVSSIPQGVDPMMDSSVNTMEEANPMGENNGSESPLNFNSPQELQELMEQSSSDPNFINQIVDAAPSNVQDLVKDSIQRFYEPGKDIADKTIIAAEIFKAIHGRGQGEEQVSAIYTKASVENLITDADKIIQGFAKKAASVKSAQKTASSYNLKKEAQFHGTGHTEFFNFGPEAKRILPYSNTGMLANDWHVWQRARDHNFIFDDHAVDFDTFWRGNIMDKYSRPYRNDKGEWVGGYMNKRFEVDRNIPEGNNLQLLPGQLRRPYLPEFATIEARMEASRKKYAEERGYDPTDEKAEAYNWHEAGVKKK